MPHENTMMPINGHDDVRPVCCSFRCPYHARVMNMLLRMRRRIVYKVFICVMENNGIHRSLGLQCGPQAVYAIVMVT